MSRLFLLAALGGLAACSGPVGGPAPQAQKAPAPAAVAGDRTVREAAAQPVERVPAEQPAPEATPLVQAIDAAAPGAAPPLGWTAPEVDPVLIRAEVLLDRAGFSPGVIDGRDGENLRRALAAFAKARGLPSAGLDGALWQALAADGAPAAQVYTVAAEDVAGPFIGEPPKDYAQLAKLPALGFSSPLQALAEKFHMDQRLLQALNPGVDFGQAGARIVVAAPRMAPRDLAVARIEVDKSAEAVRAYDAEGRLVAYYPASVGSTDRPAPSGAFSVAGVARNPTYTYDPQRLTFTPRGARQKLTIAPGPNNPVGETWIALSIPTYGIHGTPDPAAIGKHQSHGCVRLTNWDAVELGRAVGKGVRVDFVGSEQKA